MEKYSIVGKRFPLIDGTKKVTGEARFTADIPFSRLLHGKILRSPLPHARILHIHTEKAKRLPGVKTIITGKDTMGEKSSFYTNPPELWDEPPLALDKVRYIGDEVAAVAAVDEDLAEEALELISVDYEPLSPIFNPQEAMAKGAPLVHEGAKGNIAHALQLHYGDVEKTFRESDLVQEKEYCTASLHQAYMEPRLSIASHDSSGNLTLWTPTQIPYYIQKDLARTLAMPRGKVRIVLPAVGSGNCGKLEFLSYHFCSALLSIKTGVPVKVELTREEAFFLNRGAHPVSIRLKLGVKKDGQLMAQQVYLISDAGAYIAAGTLLNFLIGVYTTVPYKIPNLKHDGYMIYTNNPPSSTQRSMGIIQLRFAVDCLLDSLAIALEMDPLEIRLKNAVEPSSTTANAFKIKSCGLKDAIQKVAQISGWKKERQKKLLGEQAYTGDNPPTLHGMGMGCSSCCSGAKGFLPTNASSALVELHDDGAVTLTTGGVDVGQGAKTVLAQIVAEELGVTLEKVRVASTDTDTLVDQLGVSGSRVTFQAGKAVEAAAFEAKAQILEAASERLEAKTEDLVLKNGKIYSEELPDKFIPLAQILFEFSQRGRVIIGRGYYEPPLEAPNTQTLEGNFSMGYSFTSAATEVKLDKETGKVEVLKFVIAHDCGFPLNPMLVEGQIEGQVALGLGQALMEERILERGIMMNPSLLHHTIPTSMDMPEVKVELVEAMEPEGPYGAKECGEGPQASVAPAIANAIVNALQKEVVELPIRPEMIIQKSYVIRPKS